MSRQLLLGRVGTIFGAKCGAKSAGSVVDAHEAS